MDRTAQGDATPPFACRRFVRPECDSGAGAGCDGCRSVLEDHAYMVDDKVQIQHASLGGPLRTATVAS